MAHPLLAVCAAAGSAVAPRRRTSTPATCCAEIDELAASLDAAAITAGIPADGLGLSAHLSPPCRADGGCLDTILPATVALLNQGTGWPLTQPHLSSCGFAGVYDHDLHFWDPNRPQLVAQYLLAVDALVSPALQGVNIGAWVLIAQGGRCLVPHPPLPPHYYPPSCAEDSGVGGWGAALTLPRLSCMGTWLCSPPWPTRLCRPCRTSASGRQRLSSSMNTWQVA